MPLLSISDMTGNLVQRITNAIFRQEAEPADALNPGNLRDCPWAGPIEPVKAADNTPGFHARFYHDGERVEYVLTKSGSFWKPRSRAEGIAGAAHVVALHIAEGDNLSELISLWAPASDHNNQTDVYIAHVKEWAAIPDETVPLWNFITG